MKEENRIISEAYNKTVALNEAKAQDLIMKYVNDVEQQHGWEAHKYIELSDLARRQEFKGIHFGKILSAAKALASKKKIKLDGSKISGLSESVESEIDSNLKRSLAKILNPIKIQKTVEKVKIEIHLNQFLDNENMENFKKIDAIEDIFKHIYGDDIMVKFNGRYIEVEQL